MVILLVLAALAQAAVDPAEVYTATLKHGRRIRATTFADPSRDAYAIEGRGCYLGVYDRDQVFDVKKTANIMCQVLEKRKGGQVSFTTDFRGRSVLPEGAPASDYRPTLERCARAMFEAILDIEWRNYTTALMIKKKGWDPKKVNSFDQEGDKLKQGRAPAPEADALVNLRGAADSYGRIFGAAERKKALAARWALVGGEKLTADKVLAR